MHIHCNICTTVYYTEWCIYCNICTAVYYTVVQYSARLREAPLGMPQSAKTDVFLLNISKQPLTPPAPFLSDPSIPGVLSVGLDVSNTIQDLDVTLADEDNNSIPTDDVEKTIIVTVAMQVAPPGGQNWNYL